MDLLPQLGHELLEGGDLVPSNSASQVQGRESWHGVKAAEERREWEWGGVGFLMGRRRGDESGMLEGPGDAFVELDGG